MMRVVRLFKNSKKNIFHKMMEEDPHPNSAAGYILLKKEYQKQDPYIKAQSVSFRVWLTYRNRLLRKIKKQNKGNLECFYCKQQNLIANFQLKTIKKTKKATLDHVIPLAKGGKRFDPTNLVACCSKCNEKKADSRIFIL